MKTKACVMSPGRRFSWVVVAALTLLCSALMHHADARDRGWMAKVPAKDHARTNPYGQNKESIAAGRRIFLEHCAQCHGQDAEGTEKRPSLRSDLIQVGVSEGDLHWLLVNGSMRKGMPSWAKLPDPQLWQLVSYIKSLHE